MDGNDRRFEINNKIITVSRIKKIASYLQKTRDHYLELIRKDKEKNNNAYLDAGQYSYYAVSKPKLEYTISYTDGRNFKTEDDLVFKDALKEPQYLKEVVLSIYISYKDNKMNEDTEHNMSLYLSLTSSIVYFATGDKNMTKEASEMYSTVRTILEGGENRYSSVVKNGRFIKSIMGLAVGSIITLLLFFILLIYRNSSESIESLFSSVMLLPILGWVIAFAIGSLVAKPFIDDLYQEIDKYYFKAGYYNSNLKDIAKRDYTKRNEVLIGDNYRNLEKRKKIRKYYDLSKRVIVVRLIISLLIFVFLSIM